MSVIGIALTIVAALLAGAFLGAARRARIDRAASASTRQVQDLSGAVDEALATARGLVAATGGNPVSFTRAFAGTTAPGGTIPGLTLVQLHPLRVVAHSGAETPATNVARAAAADTSVTLIAHDVRRGRAALTFAARADTAHAVVLDLSLPTEGVTQPFALVATPSGGVVFGTQPSTSGLLASGTTVVLGGQPVRVYVGRAAADAGWGLDRLPPAMLIAGGALTILAVAATLAHRRRSRTIARLSGERQTLGRLLQELRVTEGELRASRAQLEATLRDSPDAIAFVYPDDRICDLVNRTEFLGFPCAALETPGAFSKQLHEQGAATGESFWAALRDLNVNDVFEDTFLMTDAEGAQRFVRMRFGRFDADGESAPPVYLGWLSDVTDAVVAAAREAELQDALRRAQRLESVGQLAGGIAHDFNNILAAITMSVELLHNSTKNRTEDRFVSEIERAAERGAALTRQMLTFARCDSSAPAAIDVRQVVEELAVLVQRVLRSNNALTISLADDPCVVVIDPTHLEQLVMNLAVNARDAMPAGGALSIVVRRDDAQAAVVLEVADTGDGIDPAVQARMFDPFVTTKPIGEGTGLGLATVKTIVEAAGGTIAVRSEPGCGTTFTVSLPVANDVGPASVRTSATAEPTRSASTRRVLVVDDDVAVRAAVESALRSQGHHVEAVASGAAALRVLARTRVDVVVTDLVMPHMSGAEFIAAIPDRDQRRIVAMTGYEFDVDASGLPSECVLLRKPFTVATLLAAVAQPDQCRAGSNMYP